MNRGLLIASIMSVGLLSANICAADSKALNHHLQEIKCNLP